MIVKMNKASFIFLEAEKDEALKKIRSAGVVHLEEKFKGSSDTLSALNSRKERVEKALVALDGHGKSGTESYSPEKAEALADEVLGILEDLKEAGDRRMAIAADLVRWEPWGDFEPSEVSILRSRGVDLRFYEMPHEAWKDMCEGRSSFTVSKNKSETYGIIAVSGDEQAPEAETVQLPEFGISELKQQDEAVLEKMASLEKKLEEIVPRRVLLETYLVHISQDAEYESLKVGLGNEDLLVYFTGYLPVKEADKLKTLAAENGWALILSEPSEDDPVPSLVENNKFVGMIKPLFDVFEIFPGYREMDISLDFLIFFTLFFAMLIGDAGYGLLFLGLTVFARVKTGKGGPAFSLMYLLSSAAVVWGVVTGNWFGSSAIGSIPFLKGLVYQPIAAFPELFDGNYDPSYNIKYFCFMIATVQLSIGRIKNFISKLPSLKAFAQLGWLSMLDGIYFIVLFLVLGIQPIPEFALYMIAAGFGIVVLFGEQEKGVNFFKGLLKGLNPIGLFTTFLDTISLLSDIISYIRLFAVGLAAVAIAVSFNAMAAPMMHGPAMIGGILILLLGHCLNIIMGALSLIVHGVRLNLLEYSGHLDMEWSGFKYEPFAKVQD